MLLVKLALTDCAEKPIGPLKPAVMRLWPLSEKSLSVRNLSMKIMKKWAWLSSIQLTV
jgi:hypothetical protein